MEQEDAIQSQVMTLNSPMNEHEKFQVNRPKINLYLSLYVGYL